MLIGFCYSFYRGYLFEKEIIANCGIVTGGALDKHFLKLKRKTTDVTFLD